ncbi:MAG TPA: UDP-2,3-diacylglucosamine diphosphatase [Flavobacteriales bacterium]|nr:UDP-2,3-diacylglucosamine diphosphatase [Flavobacteriales bacterium]
MQSKEKREVELVVISDVHLGTYGCRAEELLNYLRTIRPRTLILNGDIVDIWQFSKSYFPASHMKVIMYITKLLSRGTEVYYITGNHDELLRKFEGFSIGGLKVVNKLVLDLHGEPAWFFHGDVFDVTMEHSKWLAKLGGKGYDLLIMINTVVNWFGKRFGTGRISLSKRIKDSVKGAVKHINDFEGTVTDIAMQSGYRYVVCGHIHQPALKHVYSNDGRSVFYLNSGDWVENLSALEYQDGTWQIYKYADDPVAQKAADQHTEDAVDLAKMDHTSSVLFTAMRAEFAMKGVVLQ